VPDYPRKWSNGEVVWRYRFEGQMALRKVFTKNLPVCSSGIVVLPAYLLTPPDNQAVSY
jgi:hypothetical protein